MRTHKNITSNLERAIVASALNTFRAIPKETPTLYKTSTLCFASSINGGAIDLVYVDIPTWRVFKITYDKWVGKKIKKFTIDL